MSCLDGRERERGHGQPPVTEDSRAPVQDILFIFLIWGTPEYFWSILQVSELSQEYEQLSQLVAEQTQPEASESSCPELAAKEKIWEDQLHNLGEEKEQLR